uniref:Triple QxxK/R motif-containing protein n=1 Tax=Ascaris lumbricoides TaxID=6252 RepID=A0A0M3INZ8_ASCLU
MKKTFAKDGRSGRKFKGTLIKKPRKGMKQRKLKKMKSLWQAVGFLIVHLLTSRKITIL